MLEMDHVYYRDTVDNISVRDGLYICWRSVRGTVYIIEIQKVYLLEMDDIIYGETEVLFCMLEIQ